MEKERKKESGFHTFGEESGLTMPAGKPDLQAVKPTDTEKQTEKLHDHSAGSRQKEGKEGFSNSINGDKWSDGLVDQVSCNGLLLDSRTSQRRKRAHGNQSIWVGYYKGPTKPITQLNKTSRLGKMHKVALAQKESPAGR